MPLTGKGEKILANLEKEYGAEKGKEVLYAGKNKGTFTGIDEAITALCDSVARLGARIDAYCAKADDRRVLGGVGFRVADAKGNPEHVAHIEFDGDFDMSGLFKHLHRLGGWGASRDVIAMDSDDKPIKFNWDGDGADKIRSCTIDGVDILK
jgi:hypothetical protein